MTGTPQVDHDGPVPDSRGLPFGGQVLAPDDDLAWVRGKHSLVPVRGGYDGKGAPTTLRPCYLCGEPAQVVPGPDPNYAVCGFPLDWGQGGSVVAACLDRARKKQAAVTALIAAPCAEAPAQEATPAPARTAPAATGTAAKASAAKVPRKPRTRPSQPRKAPAGHPQDPAEVPVASATSGTSADPPPEGDAA